jgi:H+/gluconate symporter-like permease
MYALKHHFQEEIPLATIAMAAALIGLMLCAYRGCSIILVAPFFAVVAALGSQHYGLPIFSELYMTKLAEYVKTYYPIFLFGAVFAKLMEKGGLASAVAAKIVSTLGKNGPSWP